MKGRIYGPGDRIGRSVYRVVRHLASGGMGTVYDVEDVTVGKRYVLKTLHPDLFGRNDLARRMDAEARVLGRLAHPNIVEVFTAGTTQDDLNLPYYVMERLNGQNLRTILEKKGRLDPSHALRIAIDLLDALEHAHENGVVHRDVKPENIFLHRNLSGTTTTKLLDFGIIRLLDSAKKSETAGRFVGTLRYAAPEQFTGQNMGPHTDIYSAGLVLYEMLCGAGPFDGAREAQAIAAAHATQSPPPMSNFGKVSSAVETIVMRALEKAPENRYRDAFSCAADLRRVLLDLEGTAPAQTAVNPLSSAPVTREARAPVGLPSTRREGPGEPLAASEVTARDARPVASSGPPTIADDSGGAIERTQVSPVELGGGEHAPSALPVVSPFVFAPTETGIPDLDGDRCAAAGAVPVERTLVDRNAETRVGAERIRPRTSPGTDTEMLEPGPEAAEAGKPMAEVELQFPALHDGASTTGPVSREAPRVQVEPTMPTTKPRRRSVVVVLAMVAVGVVVGVGGVAGFAALSSARSGVGAPAAPTGNAPTPVIEPSSLAQPAPVLLPPGLDEPLPDVHRPAAAATPPAKPSAARTAGSAHPPRKPASGSGSSGVSGIPHVAFD